MKSAHLLAAVLMIAASGATGAQTLVVDGTTHDVTFYNGTFAGAFPGGPTSLTLIRLATPQPL